MLLRITLKKCNAVVNRPAKIHFFTQHQIRQKSIYPRKTCILPRKLQKFTKPVVARLHVFAPQIVKESAVQCCSAIVKHRAIEKCNLV